MLSALLVLLGCNAQAVIDLGVPSEDGGGEETGAPDGDGGGDDGGGDGGDDGGDDGGGDGGDGGGDTGGSAHTGDTGGHTGDTGPYDVCDDLPGPTLPYSATSGWSGAEDFAFDGQGYLVSFSGSDLTRRSRAGENIVVRPGLGSAAGIHMLPDGDLVFANVGRGSLDRVDLETGGSETILSGLSYPNGVEVGLNGKVYLAEHSAGRVLEVDPETGAYEVLATGMYAPNGIAFGPDDQALYWNSFGDGSVHYVAREGEGWGEPRLLGATPESSTWWEQLVNPCGGMAAGDSCYLSEGGVGVCAGFDEPLECEPLDTAAACEGLAAGDACTQELFGGSVESLCVADEGPGGPGGPGGGEPEVFCPTVPASLVQACQGQDTLDPCELTGGGEGLCVLDWQGVAICMDPTADGELQASACEGLSEYDACVVASDREPYSGVCQSAVTSAAAAPAAAAGLTELLVCQKADSGYSSHGGLDGLNVDACGNVYVTEYVLGNIWKLDPETGDSELMVTLPSSWIPNIHWGDGVGGWEADVLYVMDRGYSGSSYVFELEVGIEGAAEAFTPELGDTGDAGR